MSALLLALMALCASAGSDLQCFSCSSTHTRRAGASLHCGGDFAPLHQPFNSTRLLLANCTGENAMCFVRSWRARGRYAWIVQRGCYQAGKGDSVLRALDTPTRAMTCTKHKLAEAEYKVCLCASDWCNHASLQSLPTSLLVISCALGLISYVRGQTI